MPSDEKRLKVKLILGEPLRYFVESSKEGEPDYLVDLSAYSGNGECNCKNFVIVKQKNIKTGKPLYSTHTRCKHIKRAVEYFANSTLKEISHEILKQKL